MHSFINKYKGFLYGIIITIIVVGILELIGFIIIDPAQGIENIIIFTLWWLAFSLPIYKYEYLKKKKIVVFKILGLTVLVAFMIIVDSYFEIPDNPVTIFFLVTFWMGIVYVLFPSFFKKYRIYILGFYAASLSYFLYVRLASENFELYERHEKSLAFAFLLIPIPVFILIGIYDQWKWFKNLKDEKTKAELELLKTQINPHFFFNTLNNLYALTVKHSDKAPEVILKLSDMMRYTIYEGKKDFVAIQEEITYLLNYIELHKIRYHKTSDIQFTHTIHENCQVAPLLFIVLLENAFKHGIEMLTEGAYIKMNLSAENGVIDFSITNNYDALEIQEDKGIGMENLKRRLNLIYPNQHEFYMSSEENIFSVRLKINTK